MSIALLSALASTAVRFLVEKKKHEAHRKDSFGNTYERIVQTARKQLIERVRKFVKHWPLKEIIVKEDRLSSGVK